MASYERPSALQSWRTRGGCRIRASRSLTSRSDHHCEQKAGAEQLGMKDHRKNANPAAPKQRHRGGGATTACSPRHRIPRIARTTRA